MTDYAGFEPNQMETSADELGVGLSRAGDALADLDDADRMADVADLTGRARALTSELQEELLLSIALLRSRAELMRLADSWGASTAGYLYGSTLYRQAMEYGDALTASLGDGRGSDGTGDEVRRHMERRTWELAGYDHDPTSGYGPYHPGAVDQWYADLTRALRPAEVAQLEATMHAHFGSATIDGDPSKLATATTIATLILDARLPASAGRYWTTLDDDEHRELIDHAPALVVDGFAQSGVLATAELDALDTENAYAAFSEELKAEFELEVNIRCFMVELGGNMVASFVKMSDGSVMVEVGAGVKAGVGLDGGAAESSVGLYMDKAYTLQFDDEGAAKAEIDRLREAIRADIPDNPWESALSLVDNGIPESTLALLSSWKQHGVEQTDEAGVYGDLEGSLDELGLMDFGAEAGVRVGWYDKDDGDGNPIENGAVFRLAAEVEGDGAVIGEGMARGDVVVRAFEDHNSGDRQLEIQLTGMVAAGGGTMIESPASAPVERVLQKLGVNTSMLRGNGVRSTVTIRLPLDGATASAARNALLSGDTDRFDELYDEADVEVTAEEVTTEVDGGEIEGAVVEVEGSVERTKATTIAVYRKAPYGEMYSAMELDQEIDDGYALAG